MRFLTTLLLAMTYILKDSQTTDNDFWNNSTGREYLGTAFVAGSSYTLHRVELKLNQNASPTGNVICEIRSDASGLPSGTILATNTNTVAASSLPPVTADYTPQFDFAGLALVNGTTYHIVIHGSTGYGGGGVQWRSNTGGTAGLSVSEDTDGTPPFSTTSANSQSDFKTYFNDAAGGGTDLSAQSPLLAKPRTLLRCRPLGPGNPLREVKYYEVPAAAAPGVTVFPDVGSLVLDGFAPTIGTPVTVRPDVGSLTLTGFAPTVGLPITVRPDVGSLILTGFAPSISLPITVRPGLGQLTLTGFAPAIGLPVTVRPGVGALILTGFAPVIGLPVTVRPDVGSLLLTGFAPSITLVAGGVTVQPGTGLLVLTGFAPTIGTPVTVRPGLGALSLTGFAPAIGTPVTVRPGFGQLTLTGFQPTISFVVAGGTTAFSGELTTAPRFSGDLETSERFSGDPTTDPRFTGTFSTALRFVGTVRITLLFDGDLDLEPA